jgi:hypothetical protein
MANRRILAAMAAAGVLALPGCGGSSKPAYCSSVNDFKDAVSGLASSKTVANGVSSLTAAVDKVETSGKQLVSDAKSAFPTQISALDQSLQALQTTAKQLSDPAARQTALTQVPAEILAVKSSFDSLSSAAKSKCS